MRSVSQIFAEAIQTRNNYLQLTELDSGRSDSKMSILNLMTYVVAVVIFTYEAILDVFETRIATVLSERVNGTPQWYAVMAKMFQYNQNTGTGDELIFDENTLKVNYKTIDATHRIITQSAYQNNNDGYSVTIKVAKNNTNSDEVNNGTPYMPLSNQEIAAFRDFIQQIKFVGSDILCASDPGDILTIYANANNPVYYDDRYVTAEQAMKAIQASMIQFASSFAYDSMLHYQNVIDVIRNTEHITDIGNNPIVYIKSFDENTGAYGSNTEVRGRARLVSGYIKLVDTNGVMTINTSNITLIPASSIN